MTTIKKKYEPRQEREHERVPSIQFDELVNAFWKNDPHIINFKMNHELEVRFGTRGIKPLTKIDFDNVIRTLKSFGFTCSDEQGSYLLRIQNEYLDPVSGNTQMSRNIRTEIIGFHPIKEYCKHNDIKKMLSDAINSNAVNFQKKTQYKNKNTDEFMRPVNFDDFNFRVSYQTEEHIPLTNKIVQSLIETWEKSKKVFRYINRVTFSHPDIPVKVDISIVKSSSLANGKNKFPMPVYTTEESGIFTNPEVYEIELEVNNYKIGPSSSCSNANSLLAAIRETIKFVLMGLQGSNYPISYPEQYITLQNYMKLVHGKEFHAERIYPNDFIGPSSFTLQIPNISPINEDSNLPNIRKNYTVTDKADGDRHMMFISSVGKIYLINSNMKIIFTGAQTTNKDIFNSLIDGEIIIHDKFGKFINLYAAFDIYFVDNEDIRSVGFVQTKPEDLSKRIKYRLPALKNLIKILNASISSVIPDDPIPIRIECKQFYPRNNLVRVAAATAAATTTATTATTAAATATTATATNANEGENNIFDACNYILGKERAGLFEYNTDGLIFTPANMGVGTNTIGKPSMNKKVSWEYSFKWKPPQFNTVDFLITTSKNEAGLDMITPIFQGGLDVSSIVQIQEYKTIILRCGFDENKDGYINPCNDVINDILPEPKNNIDDENGHKGTVVGQRSNDGYKPVQFYPTNPSDISAGICNIMLKKDDTGINQMFSEENNVITDNTIVEFRYEMTNDKLWRWIPLRVRSDKTNELRQGLKNFGNAYRVANSNWHSIHNPITENMISTGNNIPDEMVDDDIYYNKGIGGSASKTRALRDFHNLYVKQLLLRSVSKKGDTLIDYACGKGGDFPKWISAKLSFVFGIDLAKDNLENRLDGACARFLNYRKEFKNIPYALFVNGNSSSNIRSGAAMLNDKAVQITRAVFGTGPKDEAKLGKGVARQYGKGEDGFNISSCQFALHYFFENPVIFNNYIRNVAECTRIGGYFIGTCYDGKLIFNLLKKQNSIDLFDGDTKIWEIKKEYDHETFEDDATSLGYKICVFQESINKSFPEYLINFDYLHRIMENYGFKLITRDEARSIGLPEGSGLFGELFNRMLDEIKHNRQQHLRYGSAAEMNALERKISFLNRYFVYKKISNVNADKVAANLVEEAVEEGVNIKPVNKPGAALNKSVKKTKKLVIVPASSNKPKIRKLNKKLVIVGSSGDSGIGVGDSVVGDSVVGNINAEEKEEPSAVEEKEHSAVEETNAEEAEMEEVVKAEEAKVEEKENKTMKKKPRVKKLVIHDEESTVAPMIIEPATEIEKIKPTRGRPKKLKIVGTTGV